MNNKNYMGNRLLFAVVNVLVGMIMTMTFVTARDAIGKAHANEIEIGILKEKHINTGKILSEFKLETRDSLKKISKDIETILRTRKWAK